MTEQCRVCDHPALAVLDSPLTMPVLMNKLYPTSEEGRAAVMGPLEFVACRHCGFTWNRAFDPELIVYDESYENDQAYSAAFNEHMNARARDIVNSLDPNEPISYLEVGCGQGRFLAQVAASAGERLRTAEGFDPAWRGGDGEGPEGACIYRDYFGVETAHRMEHPPNVVATRHTIEHVADPVGFLIAIREALGPQSKARIWVETPCVGWILRQRAMQDFFYEHCSLFTAHSLAFALCRAGFSSPRVSHVFGGQYLWAEAVASDVASEYALEPPVEYEHLDKVRRDYVTHWQGELTAAKSEGPVALWGAGAKGVSFSLLTDPEGTLIDHLIDVNPGKQGRYLPGSGFPVISPIESARRKPRTIFVMNVNYLNEIAVTAREVGISARLVPID